LMAESIYSVIVGQISIAIGLATVGLLLTYFWTD